ncbi:MAG: putative membrane protein [Verrucomicrobiales bacterium]|jgi:uncharacterized membrane protein
MRKPHLSRYLIAGITTLIPLWVTWLIFRFLFGLFSQIGGPPIDWFAQLIQPMMPSLSSILESRTLQGFLEVVLVIAVIYGTGLATSMMIGRRVILICEQLLDRIPIVKSVYGSVKKLVSVLNESPDNDLQRVVLIGFPQPEMKTVGLVTRSFEDANTGRKLVAVYVPTTPNPTSGFLEIVPADKVISTDWTMDEAMSFVISGGTIAPDRMTFDPIPSSVNGSRNSIEPKGVTWI